MTASDTKEPMPCVKAEPEKEHKWLSKLIGEWTFEAECFMGPDNPPMKSTGAEKVRSLDGLWMVGEGTSTTPDGGPCTTIMTLGYDPSTKHFVGTFIASIMTHMWQYKGQLNKEETILTLDTEGPDFVNPGKTCKYQDIVEYKDNNNRLLRSQVLDANGKWQQIMTAHYRRKV